MMFSVQYERREMVQGYNHNLSLGFQEPDVNECEFIEGRKMTYIVLDLMNLRCRISMH